MPKKQPLFNILSSFFNSVYSLFLKIRLKLPNTTSSDDVLSGSIVKVCDKISEISIYGLVFLIPIFFLPWTSDILDFNKQALLIFLVFLSFLGWMFKSLILGRFSVNANKIYPIAGALFLAYLLSTAFSVSKYESFWGWPQIASESFVSVSCFLVLYFLVSSSFSEKEISNSFFALGVSACLALAYGILQILGFHAIPLGFAKNNLFNTIGSMGSLGLFASLLLPLFTVLSAVTEKKRKMLFLANAALILIVLLLINYRFVWLISLVGSGLVVVLWIIIIRKGIFDERWMFLPIFFVAVSLFFIILSPQIKWLSPGFAEVSLSNKASFDISLKTLAGRPVFGSGPNSFAYDFAKYKNRDFNKTSLWNVNFNAGASKAITILTTTGIFGFAAFLSLLTLPVFYGVRRFIFDKSNSSERVKEIPLTLAVLAVTPSAALGYFLYNSNMSLDLIYFFSLACLTSLTFKNSRVFAIKPASSPTLAIISVSVLVFVLGTGILTTEGQRYLANTRYNIGINAWQENRKEDGIRHIKIAASLDSNLDLYFNQLALISLASLQDYPAKTDDEASEGEKRKTMQLVSDSINAANIAVSLNPENTGNWSTKAYVCRNLIGVFDDAADCAAESYKEAIKLSPTNPYLFVQEGNVYLVEALNLKEGQEQKKKNLLTQAKNSFNKAIELKNDYALAYVQTALAEKVDRNEEKKLAAMKNAEKYSSGDFVIMFQIGLIYYQDKNWDRAQASFQKVLSLVPGYADALYYSGLTYDQMRQKNEAISQFLKVLKTNPGNENVQIILSNLNSGKAALDGLLANEESLLLKLPEEKPESETAPKSEETTNSAEDSDQPNDSKSKNESGENNQ